jgi:hypothetical protein
MVAVSDGSINLAANSYDPLGRKIAVTDDADVTTDLYYSDQWQVLEEHKDGIVKAQYVWSPVYVDAMIERDDDADGNSSNGLERRLYVVHDANYNVTALLNTSGAVQSGLRTVTVPYGSYV